MRKIKRLLYSDGSFKIKGIEFPCMVIPNEINNDLIEMSFIGIKVKRLPTNIEYVEFY